MAADYYNEQGTGAPDASNGTPDWWNQNAPQAASPANSYNPFDSQNQPGYDPNAARVTDAFGWQDPTTGAFLGGPGPATNANPFGGGYSYNPGTTTAPAPGGVNQPTWGGPVAPYSGSPYPTFTPPPLPDYLQKGFALPSAADLQATPGYMERFKMGEQAKQRGAAARGTILNGGTQQALTRYGQDYASGEYGNLVNQKLGERQQQSSDYLNLAYGPAWQQNQAAVNQYGKLYQNYQDQFNNNRLSQNDYYDQQLQLLKLGLTAAGSGNPGTGA